MTDSEYYFNYNFKTIYDNFEMSKDGGETWGKAGKESKNTPVCKYENAQITDFKHVLNRKE